MYMYLRHVSGRGHRTHDPNGSAFSALPLSYGEAFILPTLLNRLKSYSILQFQALQKMKGLWHMLGKNKIKHFVKLLFNSISRQ